MNKTAALALALGIVTVACGAIGYWIWSYRHHHSEIYPESTDRVDEEFASSQFHSDDAATDAVFPQHN